MNFKGESGNKITYDYIKTLKANIKNNVKSQQLKKLKLIRSKRINRKI